MSFQAETDRLKAFVSRFDPGFRRQQVNSQLPEVSIVMPSFNQAAFIEQAILSVLNQDYPFIELIVIDGASTDGTIKTLNAYVDHLTFISEPDSGQSAALNKGFALSSGDILGWLNADDLYTPGAIGFAVNKFQEQASISVVFGDYWAIDAATDIQALEYAFGFNLRHYIYEGSQINAQASFWRRDLMERFGKFNENLHRTMDYDMLLRFGMLVGNGGFGRVDVPLACFRRHPAQKTQGFDQAVRAEHVVIARNAGLMKKFGFVGQLLRRLFRIRRAYWYWKRGGWGYLSKRVRYHRPVRAN